MRLNEDKQLIEALEIKISRIESENSDLRKQNDGIK